MTRPAAHEGVLRLATRGSKLALTQTDLARAALNPTGSSRTEVVVVTTDGDRSDAPVGELPGVGWFTAAVERALLEGRADIAVHSAKDLPTQVAEGLSLAGFLNRADPRDALVSRHPGGLTALPRGAVVGTSSPRRAALLLDRRDDLRIVGIRGNVDSRLRKLDEEEVDALVLACAGLDRLGLQNRVSERLDPDTFVPAPCQGVIALEAVTGGDSGRRCAAVGDPAATSAVVAERSVLRHLGGGCLLPLGAWAQSDESGDLSVVAALGTADGTVRRASARGRAVNAEAVGAEVADRLR